MASRIQLIGDQYRRKFRVRISRTDIYLTGKSFEYLALLAMYRKFSINGGWVPREEFEPCSQNAARQIYWLRKELDVPPFEAISKAIVNNRIGSYRLNWSPKRLVMVREPMLRSWNHLALQWIRKEPAKCLKSDGQGYAE